MHFKRALVPSTIVVAGITAAIFQPSSIAAPQDEHAEVIESSANQEKRTAGDTEDGKGHSGKDHDSKTSKDRDTKSSEDRNDKDSKDRDTKSSEERNDKDSKDRGDKNRGTSPSTGTEAKKTTGTIKHATPNTLREGTTPKKLDLNKFKITPEPEPAPEPTPQQTTPQAEPQPAQPAPAPAPYIANTGNAVVDAALAQVGTPYVWGGSQPGGFDCSGLTSWAYAQAGKTIPRTSDAQWAAGQAVSQENMQPGDIVVSYGGGHVGIYIGNGQMVHAPTSGDVVRVSPLQPIDGVVRF